MCDERESVELTPEQEKAFKALKTAIMRCSKVGIYLWDNYGTISAVNGNRVHSVCTDSRYAEELDMSEISSILTDCWHGSNADDTLYILRK